VGFRRPPLTRDGIIAVCLGALIATPVAMWVHLLLSRAAERSRMMSFLAVVSSITAWLAVITFFTTLIMLVAVMLAR
jgi:hypothetical protein